MAEAQQPATPEQQPEQPQLMPRARQSMSFAPNEVAWLDSVLNAVRFGKDLRILARNTALGSVAKKVGAAHQRSCQAAEGRRRIAEKQKTSGQGGK